MLDDVLVKMFDVNTIILNQRTITLNDSSDFHSIVFGEKFSGVVTHVTQPLHDSTLPFQPRWQVRCTDIRRMAKEFTDGILYTAPGSFYATVEPP